MRLIVVFFLYSRTVLILISMISEYCSRAEEITLVTHILPRYIGDLIQIFNSLSCKLVLGGEAVSDKTGLKKITTYNLALALRALQLILYLIPFVVVHFEGKSLRTLKTHSEA